MDSSWRANPRTARLNGRLLRFAPAMGRALHGGRLRPVAWLTEARCDAREVRYQHGVDGFPVGLYGTTVTGQFLHANPAFLAIVGYPSLDALRSVSAPALYVDPADYERCRSGLERDGVATDFETRLRRGDGALIWVRVNARAVRDPLDQTVRYEAALLDMTARKQAEEEMRRRIVQLETFAEVGRRLREANSVEQMYRFLVETSMDLLHAQRGSLKLMDADRQCLTTVHVTGAPGDKAGVTFPVAGSYSESVITTGIPCLISDLAEGRHLPWLDSTYYESLESLGPAMIVPLRAEHEIVGTVA